jgi:hypothetical protein
MGFLHRQQELMAIRYLKWQYQKAGAGEPDPGELEHQAARLVEEAHRIARERGRNVLAILKEMIEEIQKKKQ